MCLLNIGMLILSFLKIQIKTIQSYLSSIKVAKM